MGVHSMPRLVIKGDRFDLSVDAKLNARIKAMSGTDNAVRENPGQAKLDTPDGTRKPGENLPVPEAFRPSHFAG